MTHNNTQAREPRKFALGDILSVTGDKLVSPRLISGVYDIMNFITGESLFTHQLVTYRELCRTHILSQHPQLAEVDDSTVTKDNCWEWLERQCRKYGKQLPIAPLPKDHGMVADPISDLFDMVPAEKVIAVAQRRKKPKGNQR